jgi:hypothetical protein
MRKNEFFSSPFASASNSMTYPGKQYSTKSFILTIRKLQATEKQQDLPRTGPVRRPPRAARECGKTLLPVIGTGIFISENRKDFSQ